MLKQEWKSLFHNKILLLVVIVIALIPAIYAGLFLASMWDPYGNVDKLPVNKRCLAAGPKDIDAGCQKNDK